MQTVRVTVNGSATPVVSSRWWFAGSGRLSQSRMCPWKTKATTVPRTSAPSMTKTRPRNSSRCSPRVASSAWPRRRGSLAMSLLDGLALGRRRRRRRRRRLGGRELRRRVGVGRGVARDRVLELAHAGPERLPDLRQALAAEQEESDQEEQDDVPGSLEIPHACSVARLRRSLWPDLGGEDSARLGFVGWAGRKPRSFRGNED